MNEAGDRKNEIIDISRNVLPLKWGVELRVELLLPLIERTRMPPEHLVGEAF